MSRASDWLEYAAARLTSALLLYLPWRAGRAVGRCAGHVAYALDRKRRKRRSKQNLMRALPELSAPRANRILRRVYCHLCESVVDAFYFINAASGNGAAELLETEGFDRIPEGGKGAGIVFVTGHFGHWEVLARALGLLGYPVNIQARKIDNPRLDSYVRTLRKTGGRRVLDSHSGLLSMLRLLRSGENIGVLIDRDARWHGIFVQFFGRPASTPRTAARLCIRTGAPAVLVCAQRIEGENRFRIRCVDVVTPRTEADEKRETRRITQRLTGGLERLVRDCPSQWLWLHRRWKTTPRRYTGAKARHLGVPPTAASEGAGQPLRGQ